MIHYMNLNNEPFKWIKIGKKDIEMRLYDEKRKSINIGDIIEFRNNKTNEIIQVEVIKLHIYDSFADLYAKFDKTRLGYQKDEVANPSDMEEYYSLEKIKENGVIGIQIKLID